MLLFFTNTNIHIHTYLCISIYIYKALIINFILITVNILIIWSKHKKCFNFIFFIIGKTNFYIYVCISIYMYTILNYRLIKNFFQIVLIILFINMINMLVPVYLYLKSTLLVYIINLYYFLYILIYVYMYILMYCNN